MKKILSLLMALVLVFSLAACGGPEILGTYETKIDMTDQLVTEFDEGAEISGTELSLANYLDECSLTMISVFNEDGTYSQSVDAASIDAVLENLKDAIIPLMDDLMLYSFIDQFSVLGYTIETREDVEQIVGMEWEEIFASVIGVDSEQFVSDLIDELSESLISEDLSKSGKYKAEDGKLYLSNAPEEEINESAFETYVIDGDTVTITGGINIDESESLPYPFTLTKVSE